MPPDCFDHCDNCGRRTELYHNDLMGLSYCDHCDRLVADVAERIADLLREKITATYNKLYQALGHLRPDA